VSKTLSHMQAKMGKTTWYNWCNFLAVERISCLTYWRKTFHIFLMMHVGHNFMIYERPWAIRLFYLFNTSFDCILHTDASLKGLGACLLQSDPAKPKDLHTIAYIPRSLLPSEKNYAICD
jgi:hypothetical protein